MLKVIIADDEKKVCTLIQHLVDWDSMGLEVSAIVHDGEKALETIMDIKPDIVITDIRMPGYDGIELIRRTKKEFPDIYFIIISGYSHFEYAQNAIKYGVENYLLKPIKKKELINTLNKIIEKHTSILSNNVTKKEMETMIRTSGEKAKKNFLTELLFRPVDLSVEYDIEIINKEYYSHFKDGFFTIAIISPFLEPEEENHEMMSLLLTKIQSMVKDQLEPKCFELITMIWEEQIICLINTDELDLYSIKKQLLKMKLDIANLKDIFQKVNVIIGFGEVSSSLAGLYSNMERAEEAIRNRFTHQGSYIIEYKKNQTSKEEITDIITTTMKERLLSYFESLAIDSIANQLAEIKTIFEKNVHHGQLIFECYNELIDIILFGTKQYLNRDNIHDSSWFRQQFKRFYTLDNIFDWINTWITDEFEKYMEIKKNRDTKPVRLAKQYINENYSKSISLEDVSSIIGFNSAYFSSLFKKETGENFIDYVIKIRIHNAKNLLLQSNMNVEDIAVAVGYSDIKYFTKLFKKKTGLNPSEFRRLYG